MKHYSWTRGMLFFAACLLILQSGCEYNAPPSPWEESQKKEKIIPVITRVIPENNAGTASEITLIGEHFSPVIEENNVYFNQVPAIIKSASDTQIVVYRPNIIGDSLVIKVTVAGAVGIARFSPYKMEAVVEDFGHFTDLEAILVCALDIEDRVYLAMGSMNVIRLNSDESRDLSFTGTTNTNLWTDMKIGSDGYLYLARHNNIIYRMALEGGSAAEYVKFASRNDRVKCIDFDENGNLFGGGKNTGVIVVRSSTDYKKLGYYGDYEINSIRIYNGYLYVVAKYSGTKEVEINTGIWRHPIQPDGSIGDQELVLNWSTSPYGDANLNTMTFSEKGIAYIGTNDKETPVVMYDPTTSSFKPLFFGIIPSPVDQLVWGNSTYLYAIINRNTRFDRGGQFLRINTGELGAPYYGRQ
ncbi:MAG: IPT/TIG domain-containing protein [candidate division KSB1 bacterium]|nr:IPT/TIG domain-containing protein [candidate division KSB1 bacterium]